MTRRLAIDVEGDGNGPSNPVQIALSELDDFRPTGRHYSWMVRPPGPISVYATRVHGIRDSDVAHLAPIAAVVGEIAEVLRDDPIVGQAVRGDYLSLKRVLPEWEPSAGYDTFRLAKNLRPGLPSYKLVSVGDALGLTVIAKAAFPKGAHTAPFDALLAGLIAHELTRELRDKALRHALTHSNIFNFRAARRVGADGLTDPGLSSGPR
jgi:DNA polymerase-3 subunit epsilon/exodeoxyribonuclease X